MSTWPDRKAAVLAQRHDEMRVEQAIGRVLAPIAHQQRPKAIFRVVPDDQRFGFTRSLIGVGHTGPIVERFGLFETERAAHALAKRAAARFSIENPHFIVGVIGLEADDRRPPPSSSRFRAEGFAAGQVVATPECEECGKPTRYHQGRPVRFCPTPPGGPRSICLIRHSNRIERERAKTDPIAKKKKRQRSYKCIRNNPVRWAKRLAKNRALKAIQRAEGRLAKRRKAESSALDHAIELPNCVTCGKPTRFRGGKPQLYCSKVNGRSPCAEAARTKRYSEDPGKRAAAAARARDRYARIMATPEGREAMRQKWLRKRPGATARAADPLPTGSVFVTASPRGQGYELMARLYSAVPSNMPSALRAEIISETALLVLQGSEIKAAVAEASKSVRQNGSRLRYAKSIDDCFWLADETQDMREMV